MDLLRRSKLGTLVVGGLDSVVTVVDEFWRNPDDPSRSPTAQDGGIPATTNPDSTLDVITVANNTPPHLHALVIGINEYPNLPPLAGAVSDADSVTEFLTRDIGIPLAQITNLRNSTASRDGIIKGFQALRNNRQITHGSPILIYFAGHGGAETATEERQKRYGAVGKVQVIFGYDYYVGSEGEKVNCIPDKTVARLLNELAKVKGDNITVIFDSCHSASANRGVGGRKARSAAVKLAIPVDIDDDILPPTTASDTSSPLAGARHADPPFCSHQSSHTYLAACGSDEQAWEESGLGAFTAALLKRIKACGVDKITYHNLMKGFPLLDKQTPHCYGAHKSRILFNACVPSRHITYIPVIYDPTQHALTLQAGVASGVTKGSVWEVRENATEGDQGIIGRARVGVISVSIAALTPEGEGGDQFWSRCEEGNLWEGGKKKLYARQLKSGPGNELKVWFSPEARRLVFPKLEAGSAGKPAHRDHEVGYVVYPERESAEIAVEVYHPGGAGEGYHPGPAPGSSDGPGSEPEVVFHLCDSKAEKHGIATLQQRKPARRADVETVLFAAARWNWHLHRTNPASIPAKIEMFKIAERNSADGECSRDEWSFVGKEQRVNLNKDGVVDFEVYRKNLYAFRLNCEAKARLYVWMFYFDTTTFAIYKQFGHSVANSRADPNVFSQGEFVIGDGGEGDSPVPFKLDPGETLDLGYMKVFWSTEPLELDHIAQGSAFEMKVGAHPRRPDDPISSQASEWGSVLLTLVQRAPAGREN